MVGLALAAVIGVGVVGFVLFIVLSQPRPVWRAAAEHSRRFWVGWSVASVAIGLVPAATGLTGRTGSAIWLLACCVFAAFQPAMFADINEVRRDVTRRRRSTLAARQRNEEWWESRRIRWHDDATGAMSDEIDELD